MSAKLSRLVRLEWIDLPVIEASGIAVRHTARGSVVLVVGDRTAEVGVCPIGDDGEFDDWDTIDLAAVPGWPLPPGNSQFEAIAADGGSVVALMCEDPPLVLVVDTVARGFSAEIWLTAPPGSLLEGQWDDPSSRGEGLVFLRGGRLLVAQEKRPRALIEFGPIGTEPAGVSTDDLLEPGEPWDAPSGRVEFVPLSMWKLKGKAKKALGDISSIAADSDGNLWLLSDKSQRVGRVGLDVPLDPTTTRCETSTNSGSSPRGQRNPRASWRSAMDGCWWRSTPDRRPPTA